MSDQAWDLLCGLRLEDGRTWASAASPVQLADARAVLDVEARQRRHWISRSRGYSKTQDLGGVATAVLLEQLPPRSNAYALAADRDQGRLIVDSIAGFAARTDGLAGALSIDSFMVTAQRSGSVLRVLPADVAGSWGLRPAFVVVDELCQWSGTTGPQTLWQAVTTALLKIGTSRLAVITTSGDPAHWSHKVYAEAVAEPGRWRVSETHGPPPWMDPTEVEAERRRLPASVFSRLFDNRWCSAEDRLANAEDLAACVSLDGPLAACRGVDYRVGVDLGLKHDKTVISICHLERVGGGRRVVLDRQVVFEGSRRQAVDLGQVEEAVFEASRSYGRAKVRLDPWQGAGLAQRLRRRGVTVEEWTFSSGSVGRLASTLHVLIRDRQLALPDDEALIDELANVRLRETSPGVFRMDHDPGRHDDRAISLGLAALALVEEGVAGPARSARPTGRAPSTPRTRKARRAGRKPQFGLGRPSGWSGPTRGPV